MNTTFYSSTAAARILGIPSNSLLAMEARGAFGYRFQRDSAGRRLLTDGDIDKVRSYLEDRRRTHDATSLVTPDEARPVTVDVE